MSDTFTMRIPPETKQRLQARAESDRTRARTLAQRYVEEGLRMDEHPAVFFADGPAGRRARLFPAGGDVWEVIATLNDNDGDEASAAEYLDVPASLVRSAVAYYAAFPSEVDDWIERNRAEGEVAEEAWRAGREAISR